MFQKVAAAVLFVQDLAGCTAFYRDTLRLAVTDESAQSTGFLVGELYLLLLEASAGARMLGEQPLAQKTEGGTRGFLAAAVEDVDAVHQELAAKGVKMLQPPTDQPWGLRTAYFADPEGNVWEINQRVS